MSKTKKRTLSCAEIRRLLKFNPFVDAKRKCPLWASGKRGCMHAHATMVCAACGNPMEHNEAHQWKCACNPGVTVMCA